MICVRTRPQNILSFLPFPKKALVLSLDELTDFFTNRQYHFNLNKVVLGVDIGGTFTKLSLVTSSGRIVGQEAFPTHSHNGQDDYPKRLVATSKSLVNRVDSSLLGIGIGAPGCDPKTGYISYAVNLPFSAPFPIRDFFEENLCAHTALIKDSSAAALGEKMWGGAKHMDNFVLLTLGTGLGSAFYINGQLVAGAHHLASELGHTVHIPNGRACSCGQRGCLETYASARGLQRNLSELFATEIIPSHLRRVSDADRTAEMITRAAREGDELAKQALAMCGVELGNALARICLQLDPEGIFLSGGLTHAGDLLLKPLQRQVQKALLPAFRDKTTITISALGGADAGTLGAAAQVYLERA